MFYNLQMDPKASILTVWPTQAVRAYRVIYDKFNHAHLQYKLSWYTLSLWWSLQLQCPLYFFSKIRLHATHTNVVYVNTDCFKTRNRYVLWPKPLPSCKSIPCRHKFLNLAEWASISHTLSVLVTQVLQFMLN